MEIINNKLILIDENIKGRDNVIKKFGELLFQNNRINDVDDFVRDVFMREQEMSTSMGLGVAIPHAQSDAVISSSLVFIKLKYPIQWNEDKDIKMIFGIAVPKKNKNDHHLKILSQLARKLMKDEFRASLNESKTKEDVLKILQNIEL